MPSRKVHRTNLHLWAEDVEYLRRIFGHGWTTHVRDMVSKKVREIKATREANNIGLPNE